MSSDNASDVSVTSDTRTAVREKAQKVQAKQARIRWAKRVFRALVILVVLAAIGVGVYLAFDSREVEEVRYPTGMTADDGVVVTAIGAAESEVETLLVDPPAEGEGSETEGTEGEEAEGEGAEGGEAEGETGTMTLEDGDPEAAQALEGAVDIHVYVDYLAPGAADFERANARQLATWITEGAVTITYHPVALFNSNPTGSKYSVRAAGAAACVATHSPEQFYSYHRELLLGQPEAGTDSASDSDFADLAVAVGAVEPKVVRSCIEEGHFVTWAREATARALNGPLPGTEEVSLVAAPTVLVNGQAYVGSFGDPAEFSQFVLMVASQDYYAKQQEQSDEESE